MAVLRVCFVIFLLACVINALDSSQYQNEGEESSLKLVNNNVRLRHDKNSPAFRKKRLADLIRRRRAPDANTKLNKRSAYYNPWTPPYLVRVPDHQSFTLWQPLRQQIQRPYYIPVWGPPGKPPVYFPPQPIYTNPGYPADNRPNNQYLPPSSGENATVPTINKFGEGDNDRPVWGIVGGGSATSNTTVRPTRRPRPSGQNGPITHPPLIRTTESSSSNNKITPTVGRDQAVTPAPNVDNNPSRCVWAIISCCSASSNTISYDCFEQLGCNGAFWDSSPCESDFARAAISNVMNYYQTR